MKFVKMSIVVMITCLLAMPSFALTTDKLKLNGNMTIDYKKLPPAADNIKEAFTKGMLYGRLRTNIFYYDWDDEVDGKTKDHRAMGIGGNLVYKSAPFNGVSGTLGLYTSQNPEFFREDKEDVGLVKSGKDTFSRDEIKNGGDFDGHYGMTVLGQAFLQYDVSKTSLVAGRQLFETVFTKSNDTKMIPNTFDGISAEIKELSDTKIQLAYFTAQKLRDHLHSHDVIAFDSWNENDDGAVNKSLTKDLVGTDNELFIATLNNKSIKNLNATASYLIVPDVVSDVALEAHYKIPVGKWSVIPGARVMFQMDELDADTPVANLSAKAAGYDDPNDLDGKLYAARIDAKKGAFGMRLGYSKVTDDADLIAPWRGFPTGGFTRAMAQYNWRANTESYMIRFDYDFDKAELIKGFKVMGRYVIQDFDDDKPGVQADSNVIHVDLTKILADNLMMKFRVGLVDGDTDTIDMNGTEKSDISYNEFRLEFNYFF